MNPSWRVDELARRVLRAARWPEASPRAGDGVGPTPHLDELERALEIRLPPLARRVGGGDAGGRGGVRTCTLPINETSGTRRRSDGVQSDVWTWTPRTDTADNSYSKTAAEDDVAAATSRTLEEMAPFAPDFYRAMGELAREAYHPGSVKSLVRGTMDDGAASDAKSHSRSLRRDSSTAFQAILSMESFSLPRMMDAVRMTRILLALQELNVCRKRMSEVSFFQYLLHYCEGLVIPMDSGELPKEAAASGNGGHVLKGKRIPVLSALFRHWGNLPQTEHAIQQLSRKYGSMLPTDASQYEEYCKHCSRLGQSASSSRSGSVGDGGSTGGEWKPSSSTTSFLGERALRIDSFKIRIEEELSNHINGSNDGKAKLSHGPVERSGLVDLLTMLYRSSDATLRGKCRRWMGQWLRSFALGGGGSVSYSATRASGDGSGKDTSGGDNGLGPSLASFCPLVHASSLATASPPTGAAAPAVGMALAARGGGAAHNPLGMENTSACGIEALLHVLIRIILGFRPLDPAARSKKRTRQSDLLRPCHENLLFDVIMPLHRPSGMVLWRDQTPLIGLYHEALVKSIGAFVTFDRTLVGPVIGALLHPEIWPSTESGNTPKVVLLLHEVDTLIGLLLSGVDSDDQVDTWLASFDLYLIPVVSRLCVCISSENSRTSERALQLFRNNTFQKLVRRRLCEVGHLFLRALCRCSTGEVPWNPTVRKMTLLVLRELEGFYESISPNGDGEGPFFQACELAFSGITLSKNDDTSSEKASKSTKGTAKVGSSAVSPMSNDMTSLRGAMGSWKPPPQKGRPLSSMGGKPSRQPPSTVTGVAPWATAGQSPGSTGQSQPPVTVTGVAPWAVRKQPRGIPSLPKRKTSTFNAPPRPMKKDMSGSSGQHIPPTLGERVEINTAYAGSKGSKQYDGSGRENGSRSHKSAMDQVRLYMEKLKPASGDENNTDGISSWAKAQMEESPVLLSDLRFHDLVFGQELGTGAFSTVKYARHIVKTLTRSNWPEYAVKIVSTQKIEELGYESSINREIAILRTLSHPGISRLVSSFRFRDGAYLVLEYASGGDLHTLLRKNGSLDLDSTRFVVGSVAAALWSIHEMGFVYADCKPENILITESGHIKVTDFGGCRPVSEEAKALVKMSSKNLLKQLRDGDWRANAALPSSSIESSAGSSLEEDYEDCRIEGTTAYLPPEVVIGGFPTPGADIWALGCVLFQCISGKPPILEDTDDLTAQRIVSFDLNSERQHFFGDCGESTFCDDAKNIIQRMLHRDVDCRPNILQIADSNFFGGIDIFNLYRSKAHPLDVGSIAPASDAKWSRRQFSSIWAPQPSAYIIGSATTKSSVSRGKSMDQPIIEGDEADEEFLQVQNTPLLAKIKE